MWVVASDVAGLIGFPTSERFARDKLKRLADNNIELYRKREGSKSGSRYVSL